MQTEVKQSSKVVQQFSRFAHKYDTYNIIQAKVATTLVEKIPNIMYKNIIDVGCGSGEVYKNFQMQNKSVENFIVLDSAQNMLDLHPKDKYVHKICANFNEKDFLVSIPNAVCDALISSSALQWSTDLSYTIGELSSLSPRFFAALFTSGTFKTLHETAGVNSPIYDVQMIQEIVNQYYTEVEYEIHNYRLEFASTRDMFKYIKQSGVSSGERKLTYKQTKQLMETYPLNYLEFEVLFIEAKK